MKTTCTHHPNELFTTSFSMLCDVCIGMLTRRAGQFFDGTLDVTFEHHKSTKTLRQSLSIHCPICTRLARMLSQDTDLSRDQPVAIKAILRKISQKTNGPKGYEFTLDLELGEARSSRFFLAKIGIAALLFDWCLTDICRPQSPISPSSDDVS